jgi:hypothetical protein
MDAVLVGMSGGIDAGERRGQQEETLDVEGFVRLLIEAGRALPPLRPERSELLFRRLMARVEDEGTTPRRHARMR